MVKTAFGCVTATPIVDKTKTETKKIRSLTPRFASTILRATVITNGMMLKESRFE